MKHQMTISKARNDLAILPGQLKDSFCPLKITEHGKPVMALMHWDFYESLKETMEVVSDNEAMKSLRKSIRDIKEGRTYSTKEVEKRLGLEC